jgi:hypothetical protein
VAEFEDAAGVPAPAGIGALPAEFNEATWGEDGVPGEFATVWLAWLAETEPDCPAVVAACGLDTAGLNTAADGAGVAADETWPGVTRFVAAGSTASVRE